MGILCLLLVFTGLNFVTTRQQQRDAHWVSHTHEVLTALGSFESDLHAAGEALRGYLLSEDERELRVYREMLVAARHRLDTFGHLTRDNPVQQQRLVAVRQAVDRLAAVREASVQALHDAGREVAVEFFLRSRGRPLLQEIEAAVRVMAEHESGLLDHRRNDSRRAYQVAAWTAIGCGLLSTLLVGLSLYANSRHARSMAAATEQLAALTRALQEADRRKDRFLATLGHELRNPLAPIQTASDILQKAGDDPARVAWVAGVVRRHVRHLKVLVDDLLDIGRITQGKLQIDPQPVRVGALLDAAVEASQALVDTRRHRLDVVCPPDVAAAVVAVDAVRIVQVLTNLLNNAARYTPAGGHIELLVRGEGEDLVASVRDDGVGIPPRAHERVFEMFEQLASRADEPAGGLGVGLALCRAIVELHGGRIGLESDGEGRGSTFTVVLPGVRVRPDVLSAGPV